MILLFRSRGGARSGQKITESMPVLCRTAQTGFLSCRDRAGLYGPDKRILSQSYGLSVSYDTKMSIPQRPLKRKQLFSLFLLTIMVLPNSAFDPFLAKETDFFFPVLAQ